MFENFDAYLLPLQPFGITLIALACIWLTQIFLVEFLYRRVIYPSMRKNRITSFFISWVAVASHELLGHFAVGAATGSQIDDIELSSSSGHVISRYEVSVFGWFSQAISSFAPCFAPTLLLLAIYYFAFPNQLLLPTSSFQQILLSQTTNIQNFAYSLTDLFNPFSLLLLYLIMPLSLTAASSTVDLKGFLSSIVRHPLIFLSFFIISLIIYASLLAFGINPSYAVFWFVTLSFALVLLGNLLSLALAILVELTTRTSLLPTLLALLSFPSSYYYARMSLLFTPSNSFILALSSTALLLFFFTLAFPRRR
ncbi:MAG: hypothetical protein ABIH99_03980 [Candidatus Micrarchaeota archaeon]